ncbi:zinc carboxypeptidase [Nocardia tenerifensis]|uniref:Zinc carboxypeptidase n=1 Tax=Nocardia tenerifensis TaxID=228006 RepID=A0A318JVR0_9NOCA|nr:M14 family zinc carboxypeptidase [Nocardia tenerifensis]PXX57482.1 zinc carboxypeptidase [Nocardia tenerifensis]
MHDVREIVGPVDRSDVFPTVDELSEFADGLVAAMPDRVTVADIGRSRGGDPIREVRVGSGPRQVVVVGNPHPNEPIGMATIRHLLGRLTADDAQTLDATWHFVLCLDPDGTRLNEGWFAGERTRSGIARAFYRPPAAEQPEWCFPTTWRGKEIGAPLPETLALMELIDRTRPALIVSLHNADFGGGFFYTTGGDPDYWTGLTDQLTAGGVPIFDGEPDVPGAKTWAPGVFELPRFQRIAETLVADGVEPLEMMHGGGVRDYAAAHGTALLVCEVPLWADPRVTDDTPSGRSLANVLCSTATAYEEVADLVRGVLDRVSDRSTGRSPFARALTDTVRALRGNATAKRGATESRIATVGELFVEDYVWVGVARLRAGGMLLRLLDEQAGRAPSPGLAAERAHFAAIFEKWCGDIETNAPGHPIPVHQLVTIQASAIVAAVLRLRADLPV